MAAQFFESAMDSFTIALFTRYGGYTEEGVRDLLNRVRNELKSNKLHVYTTVYVPLSLLRFYSPWLSPYSLSLSPLRINANQPTSISSFTVGKRPLADGMT